MHSLHTQRNTYRLISSQDYRWRWFSLICAFLFSALPIQTLYAQNEQQSEYKFKAVYLYNFLQFVDWPSVALPQDTSSIIIGVLSNKQFADLLEQTVKNESIKSHSVIIKHLSSTDDLRNCHILFLSKSQQKRIPEILEKIDGKPILTVSEVSGFAQAGGAINFYLQNNKLRFEINVNAVKKANLSISSKLLRLAKIVELEN